MQKTFLLFSGISGAIAVILGALGAHALQNLIMPEQLQSFETGVKYQVYHTLAIMLVSILNDKLKSKHLKFAAYFFITGIFLFSGSIYLLSTRNLLGIETWTFLGPITPIGGLAFICGWIFIFISGWKMGTD